jgi:VanZ family protein
MKGHIKKRWLWVLAAWLLAIYILSGSAFSDFKSGVMVEGVLRSFDPDVGHETVRTANLMLRKGAHVGIYTVVAIIALMAMGSRWRQLTFRVILLAVCCACLDELHQKWELGRSASLIDVIWDLNGCLLGIMAFHGLDTLRTPRGSLPPLRS